MACCIMGRSIGQSIGQLNNWTIGQLDNWAFEQLYDLKWTWAIGQLDMHWDMDILNSLI